MLLNLRIEKIRRSVQYYIYCGAFNQHMNSLYNFFLVFLKKEIRQCFKMSLESLNPIINCIFGYADCRYKINETNSIESSI